MTPTTDLIRTDRLGRITVSRAHRDSLMEAFDKSSMSAQSFAKLHGIKYTVRTAVGRTATVSKSHV